MAVQALNWMTIHLMYFDIPNYETISFYNDVDKYDGQKVLSRLSVWLRQTQPHQYLGIL